MNTVATWLEPLRSALPEIADVSWDDVLRLDADLASLGPAAAGSVSAWLLEVRRDLHRRGYRRSGGTAGVLWQTLAQFTAGFHDLDLRDCLGAGHGAMILAGAPAETVRRWRPRLQAGALVGIAATERHGGSRIQEITARARPRSDGRWALSGEKCWVSRLTEADGFVVFFRDPDSHLSAAVVDAQEPGLHREVIDPHGLGGWSWGVLTLHNVLLTPSADLIGRPGEGLAVFRRHFAGFRPLVTATALGTAAGAHTLVAEYLAARRNIGVLPRIRDNALITLGQVHAEITAYLLAALHASRLTANGHPRAEFTAQIAKAAGVDAANRALTQVAPLIGAAGFQRAHPLAKARADLCGLLYADGIHDSLYRAGGTDLLHRVHVGQMVSEVRQP